MSTGPTDPFELLEQNLEVFIENVREVGIMVGDFQPQTQQGLNSKIESLVLGLKTVDQLKGSMGDVVVPLDVFNYIDQGKNPQLYTHDCLENAIAKNAEVKGKIESLKRFRGMLLLELHKVFPNEIAKYRAIRGPEERDMDS